MQPMLGRVLVVDDHPRNVAILQKILAPSYRVATAATGEEALEIAPAFAPDIALLDIMMPGIDGYEVCRRFRAIPQLAHTKIIMVSAKAMISERLAGYEAGADDYVIKPFDEDELLVKVRVFTRLKKVEEVDRLKSEVLMLLSHETRTPLTTILSPLEMVLDDPGLSGESREFLRMAQDGAKRLNQFVERLVFLNQLHGGLVEFDLERHDLTALVSEAVEAARGAAEAAGVSLVVRPSGPLEANVDLKYVRRVVDTLLDNAVRLSPRGTAVELDLERRDGMARLTVTDHGPGVPEHFLPRVFDGLAVPDIEHHHAGPGLGLVTARAIVRHHEGTLSAENGSAAGAIFTLQLPLVSATEESSPRQGASQARVR